MNQPQERYLVLYSFGSFVYLFLIIGVSTGVVFGAIGAVFSLTDGICTTSVMSAIQSLVTTPLFTGISFAISAAIAYWPYKWLCKRGWGWPTKGVFVKVQDE